MIDVKCSYSELVSIEKLVPNPRNDNTHTEKHADLLAKVLKAQGIRHPIIVSKRSGFICAGHLRLMAAVRLKLETFPVDYQDFESEAAEYQFLSSDNNVARYAELNEEKFLDNLKELDIDLEEIDFEDLGLLDFELPNIEVVGAVDDDEVPEVKHDPITKRGDIWLLGDHRVMCGDSTMIDDVEKLMDGEKADMVFTDPPYFEVAGDFDFKFNSFSEYLDLINAVYRNVYSIIDNGSIYICLWYKHLFDVFNCIKELGYEYRNLLIWDNTRHRNVKRQYSNCYEPILFFTKNNYHFDDSDYLLPYEDQANYKRYNKKGKNIEDIISIANIRRNSREASNHPTQKPLELIEQCIGISSLCSSKIVDLFLGSGSTLIACEKTKRKCYGMELDEHYCDVIINRWQDFTSKDATLESTGQTYKELLDGKTS